MLRHLSIRDFVIVDVLDLELDTGFTVFSGETGAGKSILIDALALALGARGDGAVVRTGAARADISAEFDAPAGAAAWLIEQALEQPARGRADAASSAAQAPPHAVPQTILLRRVIDAGSGRSRAFINGTPATLGQLRELGEMLVDIHGQHAHQLLMRADAQRTLFDTHAGLVALAAQVHQAWQAWRATRAATEAAHQREREIQLEREQLAWQVAELDRLAPQPGEWEEVGNEHRRLSHAASLIDGVRMARDALSESDDALVGRVASITQRLQALAEIDEGLKDALAALEPAQIQLQEAAYSLSHYAQRLDLDPQRLAEVEGRLDALHTASRKFRIAPESLGDALGERRARLTALDAEADLDALNAAEHRAAEAYGTVARTLSAARQGAAATLSTAVTAGMQELSMAGGSFEVALLPLDTGGAHGLEQIEFRVAGHPGVPRRPLSKVASGGELARISLALAVIASSASPTPTLIFDEVDTGIGGAVAEVVGRLLHQLGQIRQVLCVTHLPQVAARGDSHLRVAKAPRSDGAEGTADTVSTVSRISAQARVEEIARMLGGIAITPTSRRHAREMLTT
ncbi:DNA repair protein RecN [Robbsia sp. Bb-Pol-6]|uniref:DNA repair protein RecN n=1 Tax=Robbsia betulipollinis TaxID=2981849 RepID=A0ABT3ZQK2_9BURK|nr:DNA repair protein RecN [Robbsia betulipollinis]MCY0388836.1 DNA repair protein RecN [Robbsia betulipollinis]